MDLVSFLQFGVKYFLEVLAWPLLALVYPLLSSVRAIEINSFPDTQKLNAYWVILSLSLLLELSLGSLLEWFPFWAYIKLMMFCLLVIPYFDGAFYVYKHLVWPMLSIKHHPRVLINWFAKRKDSSLLSETILAQMETYARENGPEALEKLIACKVSQTDPIQTQTQNGNLIAAETKERVVQVVASRNLPETSASKKVQNEWTCPICDVTTPHEKIKISHLQGKKHKAAYEALKAKNQTSLLEKVPPPIPKESGPPTEEPGNSAASKGSKHKTTPSDQFSNECKAELEKTSSQSRRHRRRRKNKVCMEHEEQGKDGQEEEKLPM